MAYADTIILDGSSVKRGLGALLSAVPAPDYERVFGVPAAFTVAASLTTQAPTAATVPNTRMWTPRMPYATWDSRTITSGGGSGTSTLTYSGSLLSSTHTQDSWLFIQTAVNGQGLLKRIDTHTDPGSVHTVTIVGTWGGSGLSDTGTVIFLSNTHTISGSSTGTTVTKSSNTAAWTVDALIGRYVIFYAGAAGHTLRRITDNDATTITVDDAVTVTDLQGMQVLDGANAVEDLASMATVGNAVLQPLQIICNNAPCLFTGLDYNNYDLQPRVSVSTYASTDTVINCDPELFSQLHARFGGTLYGIDISRDSCTISPYPTGTIQRPLLHGWQHDITNFDLHPSSANSLYSGLVAGIESLRALIAAEGNTMRARMFITLCAENDQIRAKGGAVRHLQIGQNLARQRDAIRAVVGDPKLPFIAIGPGSPDYPLQGADSSAYPYREAVYEQLEQLEMEDTHTTFVDLRDADRYQFVSDNLHLDAPSQINLGVDTALAYDRVIEGSTLDDVGICNLALSHIGESAKITSLDITIDTSAQARHCARFYEPALRTLLEMHSWDFATRRIDAIAVTNTREDEWAFAYEAPRGMAFAIAVLPPGSPNDAPTQPFIKEVDASGRTIIYTDVEDAVLRFNRYCTNTRKMSASFARALSWLIASDLVGPITKESDGKREAFCLQMMRSFFGVAATHDSNQRKVEPEIEAPWMPQTVSRFDRGFPLSGV